MVDTVNIKWESAPVYFPNPTPNVAGSFAQHVRGLARYGETQLPDHIAQGHFVYFELLNPAGTDYFPILCPIAFFNNFGDDLRAAARDYAADGAVGAARRKYYDAVKGVLDTMTELICLTEYDEAVGGIPRSSPWSRTPVASKNAIRSIDATLFGYRRLYSMCGDFARIERQLQDPVAMQTNLHNAALEYVFYSGQTAPYDGAANPHIVVEDTAADVIAMENETDPATLTNYHQAKIQHNVINAYGSHLCFAAYTVFPHAAVAVGVPEFPERPSWAQINSDDEAVSPFAHHLIRNELLLRGAYVFADMQTAQDALRFTAVASHYRMAASSTVLYAGTFYEMTQREEPPHQWRTPNQPKRVLSDISLGLNSGIAPRRSHFHMKAW